MSLSSARCQVRLGDGEVRWGGDQHSKPQFLIIVKPDRDNKETPQKPDFTEFPQLMPLFFFLTFSFHYWKTGASIETANATMYIWQVLASAEQAVTLEGVDRNVAALSELRGKCWLQRPFFFFFVVLREKSIFQSPSHGQAIWCFFSLSLSRWLPTMWNKLRVTPGKIVNG